MNPRARLQIVAILIAVVAAAAAYFGLIRGGDSRTGTSTENLVKIGDIQNFEGQIERRLPRSVNLEAVHNPGPLYNQDLVITQKASSATLTFNTGTSVRLAENTRFVSEIDEAHPGAMIGTILDGNVTVLAPGSKNSFHLIRDGHEVALDKPDTPLVPVISGAAGAAAPSENSGLVITATLPDESATPTPKVQAPSEEPGEVSNDVLTNEDIVRQLRAQTGFFQRCYLNFIHRTQSAASTATGDTHAAPGGTVVVGFVVQPTGRVGEAKIVRSDFKDTTLSNCITEVIERTRFKGFRGEKPVPVQEFPITLQ